jgi:tetratricopeptide (TPR) repeat protein
LAIGFIAVRTLSASRQLWMGRDSLDQLPGPISSQALAAYDLVSSRLRGEVQSTSWDDYGPRLLSEALVVSGNGVEGGRPRLVLATDVAREAIRRQPLRPDAWRRLGDALAARTAAGEGGLAAGCDSAFARAVQLAPCDGYQLVQWSRARIALGRYRDAREPAERAVALYPDRGNAYATRAISELAVGDSSAARRDLDRALGLEWYADGGAHDLAVQLRADLGPGRAAGITIPASASTRDR